MGTLEIVIHPRRAYAAPHALPAPAANQATHANSSDFSRHFDYGDFPQRPILTQRELGAPARSVPR